MLRQHLGDEWTGRYHPQALLAREAERGTDERLAGSPSSLGRQHNRVLEVDHVRAGPLVREHAVASSVMNDETMTLDIVLRSKTGAVELGRSEERRGGKEH